MANGTEKAIESISAGDEVLSFNERTARLEARRVEKVHSLLPAPVVHVRFDSGANLHVTPTHKLCTTRGWKAVAELVIGDYVLSLSGQQENSHAVLRSFRVDSITSAGLEGRVYDLSIDTTHTYFADSVLAHNKLP